MAVLHHPGCPLAFLNAKDGTVRWDVVIADSQKGYWMTMAPMVIRNHVIVGVSGDFDNLSGFLKAIDPETGKTQWRWDSTPPASTPGATTGGMTWMTGTYDPDLNLLYWGTGNPTPGAQRKSASRQQPIHLQHCRLNPDTGKLQWAFQPSPHDTHDWDAVETPVLVDGPFAGRPRKMLMQSSRNGYFFVDRTDGKSLLTVPYGPVIGRPGWMPKDARSRIPTRSPRLMAASLRPTKVASLTTARPASIQTGLFIVDAHPS